MSCRTARDTACETGDLHGPIFLTRDSYRDDLESFYYVLCYVITSFAQLQGRQWSRIVPPVRIQQCFALDPLDSVQHKSTLLGLPFDLEPAIHPSFGRPFVYVAGKMHAWFGMRQAETGLLQHPSSSQRPKSKIMAPSPRVVYDRFLRWFNDALTMDAGDENLSGEAHGEEVTERQSVMAKSTLDPIHEQDETMGSQRNLREERAPMATASSSSKKAANLKPAQETSGTKDSEKDPLQNGTPRKRASSSSKKVRGLKPPPVKKPFSSKGREV
jgi:hypothetical protein